MIYDSISRLNSYVSVSPNVKKFVAYMAEHDISHFEPGHYVVDDTIYFDVKSYSPRSPEIAGWETHKKYLDIQYLMEGKELMGVALSDRMQLKEPYDEVRDKMTYLSPDEESVIHLRPGQFVLLLPQDAHHPSIVDEDITQNKKAVVKIRL